MKPFFILLILLITGTTFLKAVDSIPDAKVNIENSTVSENKSNTESSSKSMHQVFKQKFIEGGVPWMTPILLLLIIGLALAIERIMYLTMATINVRKLLNNVEESIKNNDIEKAKEICRNTRGPIASIFYQGLDRAASGIDVVEKSVIAYGTVQSGLLEKGLTWLSLFISLAPMLGFLGTVVGLVQAFDAIEMAGDISPIIVARGLKVALLTTIFGLIVAMILQVFYNYLINKIDGIVNSMEDATISLIDILVKNYYKKE